MRKCIICKESQRQHYCDVDNYAYIQCDNCQLLYTDIIENWDKLQHSYDGGFFKSLRRKLMAPIRGFHQHKNFDELTNRADAIIEFCNTQHSHSDKINFLDIGCNKGFLLVGAIKNSWSTHGVEVIDELLSGFRKSYQRFANQAIAGKVADAQLAFANKKFNIITAIDVIEHLEDPVKEMKIILSMLVPDGIFVIQTPDISCYQATEEKEKWGALKPLEHLHLFSPKNLEILSAQTGFKSIDFHPCFEEADGNFVAVLRA